MPEQSIERLVLLVHPFCWASIHQHGSAHTPENSLRAHLQREQQCADAWEKRLETLDEHSALAVIPFDECEAAEKFLQRASRILGMRLLVLDAPDPLSAHFWASAGSTQTVLLADLAAILTGQQYAWNKEELHTALHCQALAAQFRRLAARRGLCWDGATLSAEAWGASFEGCVTKYSLHMRRALGLTPTIDIIYDMTVPDADFLLPIENAECMALEEIRLFFFKRRTGWIGLYSFREHTPADGPAFISLPCIPEIRVISKQGIRLWPEPELYHLPSAPPGCYERPEIIVRQCAGRLIVPVNAGYVYRLAKAPAYIELPPAQRSTALGILENAHLVRAPLTRPDE